MVKLKENSESKPNHKDSKGLSVATRNLLGQWESLELMEGVLYRVWPSKYNEEQLLHQVVAPREMRKEIFHLVHSLPCSGHLGLTRTLAAVRNRFYWPGCKADLSCWLRECGPCARVKPGPKHKAKLVQDKASRFLERVAVDIVGELPVTDKGNRYFLSVTDYFTKWCTAFPLPDQTAQSVADVLVSQFFSVFGCPDSLHSDQGRNFESQLFHEVCKRLGIKKTRTAPYNPRSDGLCERWNKTVQQMLKTLVSDQGDDWDDYLPYVIMAYNSTPQESTGLSLHLMVFWHGDDHTSGPNGRKATGDKQDWEM